MRQSKLTETQIVSILKEADAGRPVNYSGPLRQDTHASSLRG